MDGGECGAGAVAVDAEERAEGALANRVCRDCDKGCKGRWAVEGAPEVTAWWVAVRLWMPALPP